MVISRLGFCILIFGCISGQLQAQNRIPARTSQVTDQRVGYIRHLHDSISSPDRRLINGESYYPHQKNARNHPFYREEGWVNGTVTIRGHQYSNQLMRYDIHLDQPVLLYIESGAKNVSLTRKHIDSFTLGSDAFVYLEPGQATEGRALEAGFYQVITEGAQSLYVRWVKNRIRNEGFRPDEFQQKSQLLLKTDGRYYRIRNDRQLRNSLGQYTREVRKFMQTKNIHVSGSRPAELAMVLKYYQELTTDIE